MRASISVLPVSNRTWHSSIDSTLRICLGGAEHYETTVKIILSAVNFLLSFSLLLQEFNFLSFFLILYITERCVPLHGFLFATCTLVFSVCQFTMWCSVWMMGLGGYRFTLKHQYYTGEYDEEFGVDIHVIALTFQSIAMIICQALGIKMKRCWQHIESHLAYIAPCHWCHVHPTLNQSSKYVHKVTLCSVPRLHTWPASPALLHPLV